MATRKQTTVPDYAWVDYVVQLQALTDNDDAKTFFYNALVYISPVRLVNVNTFCAAAQPLYTEPVLADFQSGAWIQMYKNAVDQANYFAWCEEY